MSVPLLVSHPACTGHVAPGHPERPERLAAIEAAIAADPQASALPRLQPVPAVREQLERVHDPAHVDRVFRGGARFDEAGEGGGWLDPDTWMGPGSLDAALAAAGAGVAAVSHALSAPHQVAFCLARPPGHHATRGSAMGFCLFNNAAVAAQAALDAGLNRVAVIDFDVHHGNGTQDIFYDRADVLYLSCHQWPLYPGTGAASERGTGAGLGYTLNSPMSEGSRQVEYLDIFRGTFWPALREYRPELLVVSAGFDAHERDPLAGMRLTTGAYGLLADEIRGWAGDLCEGRQAWLLEGGYDLQALSESVVKVLERLST